MQSSQLEPLKRFNRLDTNPVSLLPRSCLYQLEPCGVKTAYIESITSYTKRLAEAHNVTTSQLIRRKLSLLEQAHLQTQALHWLGKRSAALVGTTATASDLVEVLAEATLTGNLQLLTMLPWKGAFPSKGMTHSTQMWCPLCYQEQKENGSVIYEPLIWAFKPITLCSIHHYPLQDRCPYCNKQNYPMDYQSRPGYCSKCAGWLGQKLCTSSSINPSEKKWDWAVWVCDNLSQLIESVEHPFLKTSSEQIRESFNFYLQQKSPGNISAFARYLGMNQPTVQSWCSGGTLPQIGVLLKVCQRLNVKLLDFLTVDSQPVTSASNSDSSCKRASRAGRTFKSPRLNLENTKYILKNALENDYPPPSVKEVIQQVGCCSATIHKYFPDLCRAIAQRHLEYKRSERTKTIQQILSQVLEENEEPPPSLQEISERVGMLPAVFYRCAPDLCSAISERYSSYRRERGIRVIKETCERVRQAVFDVHNQGIYPSSNRIMEKLCDRHIFRQDEIRDTWYRTLQELGLKT